MSETITTEIVTLNPEEFGIEPKQALELMTNLPLIKKEREPLIALFNEVSEMDIESPETAKIARDLRLKIRDNRTKGIVDWHRKSKEVFLRGGQFVDAIKNQEISINERMETLLGNIEKHAENLEKERFEKLNEERVLLVSAYLEDTTSLQLANMEEDVFQAYLSVKKTAYEDRIKAEKQAEADRIAKEKEESEAREQQRLENERLKAEAELREKELEAERKNAEKLRLDAEKKLADERAKLQAEADKKEAEQKAILDAERKANEEKLEKERQATAKLEAELKAKKDAEIKAEQERKAEELRIKQQAELDAKAPIKERLKLWVDNFTIETLKDELRDNETAMLIEEKFDGFCTWAGQQIEKM